MSTKRLPIHDLIPDDYKHLIPVSKESFYSVIGSMDPRHRWLSTSPNEDHGYIAEWTINHKRIAVLMGGTTNNGKAFLVTGEFFNNHADKLERIEEPQA